MEDIFYWIWLSILDFKPIEKIELLRIFNNPKEIFKLSKIELEKYTAFQEIIEKILDIGKRKLADIILNESIENKIKVIVYTDKIYSKELRNIYDFPIVLYGKGNIELLNKKSIAIVGCRDCSEYGKNISEQFSYMLSKKGYCIVSGMARGIDAKAHIGALKAKEDTIAVLGSGVNYIYPLQNKKIYEEILNNNGLVLSEFGINTKAIPSYFPQRNRIISGLSEKVLVVEATQKSGSIITANLAIEQGKNVYAVPGNITSEKSKGTNLLIKDGAILVSSLEDILDL